MDFGDAIAKAKRHMNELRSRAGNEQRGSRLILPEALEELQVSLEELHVAEEELHGRHQELAQTARLMESDRLRYKQLFESAPDPCLITTSEGVIREANRALEKLVKTSMLSLVGQPLAAFVQDSYRQRVRDWLLQAAQGNEVRDVKLGLRPGPVVEASILPLRAERGSTSAVRWLLRDTLEKRGRQQVSSLEEAHQALVQAVPAVIIQ